MVWYIAHSICIFDIIRVILLYIRVHCKLRKACMTAHEMGFLWFKVNEHFAQVNNANEKCQAGQ